MPNYIGSFILLLFLAAVLARVALLRGHGVNAFHFGNIDRKDFFIPPFVIFYLYTVFAAAFGWPLLSAQTFFTAEVVPWIGVVLCLAGYLIVAWSIVSFGNSFRVGIDTDHPARLVTSGVFALTRNPIYVGFWAVMLGEFLIFSNWVLLVYLVGASWLFHRQVLREEAFLRAHYGREYVEYAAHVHRYI